MVRRQILAVIALVLAGVIPSDFAIAGDSVAHGTVTTSQSSSTVELFIDKRQRATLRVADARSGKVESVKLVTNAHVIPMLIDRRLSFLWPALLDWAGPSLERLRARMLTDSEAAFARGKTAYGSEIAAYIGGKAAAYEERGYLLTLAGEPDRAIAMLRQATADWATTKPWGKTEQGILLNTLGGFLDERGRTDDADHLLAAVPEQLGPGAHLLNTMATHGVILAEAGRYRQALEVVDATAANYRSYAKTIGGMLNTIPGSERYFASVRGCALAGLGRTAEAQAALAPVLGTGEPGSLILKVAETNSEVRMRAYSCLRDHKAFAREVLANLAENTVPPTALAPMQPGVRTRRFNMAVLRTAQADPQVIAALAPIARPLPPELLPALNNWTN